jgi:branched-chain amino acid transport system permease protein
MSRLQAKQLGWGVAVAVLFLLPRLLSEIQIYIITEVLIYALFGVGFNLMFGYAGLLPFGIAALFGVGAYCTALILNHFPGIPLLLVLLSASLSGFLAAVIIGFFYVDHRNFGNTGLLYLFKNPSWKLCDVRSGK